MSTRATSKARRRAYAGRHLRRLGEISRSAFNVVRPTFYATLLLGGLWLAWDELRLYVWHHNLVLWVVALVVAGTGAYGLYRQVSARIQFRRWLRSGDAAAALESAPSIGKLVRILPPWYRSRYLRRRTELREAGQRG